MTGARPVGRVAALWVTVVVLGAALAAPAAAAAPSAPVTHAGCGPSAGGPGTGVGNVPATPGAGNSPTTEGGPLVVDPDRPDAYATIGAALSAVGADGTVCVRPGTYTESVLLRGNVSLVAPAGATLAGDGDRAGIRIPEGSAAPTVRGLTVTGFGTGVAAADTAGAWSLRNVTVTGNGVGVDASNTTATWRVTDSRIAGNERVGLDAAGADPRGDATGVWWGGADGPAGRLGGSGDRVVGNASVWPYALGPDGPVGGDRLPPLAPNASAPTNLDADPALEDLNGNGRLDAADVVVLFEALEHPAVRARPSAFDYSGDGQVGFEDVVALFEALFGGDGPQRTG